MISVVIAVFNGEDFLADAIRSVLAQRDVSLELIVVDDGSTDGSATIATGFEDRRVTVLRQNNRGVSSARNAGIAVARGDFIAFLDADDVWRPEKLRRQMALFERRPQLGLVYTGYAITDRELRTRGVVLRGDLERWLMLEGNGQLLSSTGVVRRSAIGDDLLFDERLSTSADVDVAWRVRQRAPVGTVPLPLVLYRTHARQMHTDFAQLERDVTSVYEWVFDSRDPARARLRRRGMANLYTRVAVNEVRLGHPRTAVASCRRVLALEPRRLVLLPLGAVRRRAVRKALGILWGGRDALSAASAGWRRTGPSR
jgi:glycosyltransferase involved in cell wall biosynthesis